jgi:hypothetical protein
MEHARIPARAFRAQEFWALRFREMNGTFIARSAARLPVCPRPTISRVARCGTQGRLNEHPESDAATRQNDNRYRDFLSYVR